MLRTMIGLAVLAAAGGCGSWRVVLEPVPPADSLLERTVLDESAGDPAAAKVVLIEVDGLIADASGGWLGGGLNPVAEFARELDRAADDDRVRAVVVRINSRGGTVTGSDMVHGELMRFRRETGRPVVALLGEVAASGGYYLACGADEILAHPTTITGSIGVITQTVQMGEALDRLGITADAIVSGPNKAMASPFGRPDPQHRALLQAMVDDFYARFVEVVRAGRPGIEAERLPELADGRVFTGRQALEVGLVDGLGDAHEAFARARDLAGVDRARLVRYLRPGERSPGVHAQGRARTDAAAPADAAAAGGIEINLLRIDGLEGALLPETRFLYLWATPGG
jgi:protease-4